VDLIGEFVDIIIHLDVHLKDFVSHYGTFTYLVLFLVIFCETGLVVTPFLPGDSLLFAIGTIAAFGALKIELIWGLLFLATIIGDSTNYWIGFFLGSKVSRYVKREYLERTQHFYEKHGGKTIILARYIPIVRTFAPFVAGIGRMKYGRFIAYSLVGALTWVSIFMFAGYFFGNIPFVQKNFTFVVMAIVLISVVPAVIEFLRQRHETMKKQKSETNP
jgi:membrane-associated protein